MICRYHPPSLESSSHVLEPIPLWNHPVHLQIYIYIKIHPQAFLPCQWNPVKPNELVTVGDKLMKFWAVAGSSLTSKRVTFGDKGKLDSMMCVAFTAAGDAVTGGNNGAMHVRLILALFKCILAL